MIKICDELHSRWIGYIEYQPIPYLDNSLQTYNISLFDPSYRNIFKCLNRKRWNSDLNQCFKHIKRMFLSSYYGASNLLGLNDQAEELFTENIISMISSDINEESGSLSSSNSNEEDNHSVDKSQIRRKSAYEIKDSDGDIHEIACPKRLFSKSIDITSTKVRIPFVEETPCAKGHYVEKPYCRYCINKDNREVLSSSDESLEEPINPMLGERTDSEKYINTQSLFHQLHTRLYYKNSLILDEEFDNSIFEVFEPVIEDLEQDKILYYKQPTDIEYGIEHIILETVSEGNSQDLSRLVESNNSIHKIESLSKSQFSGKRLYKNPSNPMGFRNDSKSKDSPLRLYKFKKKQESLLEYEIVHDVEDILKKGEEEWSETGTKS